MAESETQNASIAVYHYLCQNVVGTEEHVKTLRLMNTVRDNLQSNTEWVYITSGSFGEGLMMRGSDFDVMRVVKQIEVCEDTQIDFNADKNSRFTLELEDTQPGFTKLRLVQSKDWSILIYCNDIDSDFYFSNISFKKKFSTNLFSTIHGPCISDDNGVYDIANCLHCTSWISPAKQWVARSNNSWPRSDVKQAIVQHGVLFVPVGVKGSTQEELEWRMSFSVGEKLLIYSFTHTQLLCYALMKILLKDVIALDIGCKELLCSYFIKTILFWMCEELQPSIWKPENLISCYMRCFRRLIYCVEFKVCPHYFIPEINLFNNKIRGHAQETLLNKLFSLNNYGWKCILLSDQISNLNVSAMDISKKTSYSYAKSIERLLNSHMYHIDSIFVPVDSFLEKIIYKLLLSKSSKIKYLYIFFLSKLCCRGKRFLSLEDVSCNKSTYKEYNTCTSTMFLNTHHDAVSGWCMLASFFYKRKQYNRALSIIQYSLLKCSPEKFYDLIQFSEIHYELLDLHVFRNMPIGQVFKFLLLSSVNIIDTKLQPDELKVDLSVCPSIVYAHFLCFLCRYHLKNSRQCWDTIRDLQLTIEENYFILSGDDKGLSYNILGIGFQLLGDIESARQAYMHSIEIIPDEKDNSAFQKLSLLS